MAHHQNGEFHCPLPKPDRRHPAGHGRAGELEPATSGHDYAKLLRVADEIQPWVYYDTGEESKAIALVYALNKQWPGRVRPALGLWSATPASVGKTLVDLAAAHRVQVTPYSKMGTLLH